MKSARKSLKRKTPEKEERNEEEKPENIGSTAKKPKIGPYLHESESQEIEQNLAQKQKLIPLTYLYNDEDLKTTDKGIPKYACISTRDIQFLPIHIDINGVHKFFENFTRKFDCNTILITGPPGMGKTSSILAGACHAGLIYARFGKDFQNRLKSKHKYLANNYTPSTVNAKVLFPLMKLQGLQLIHEALLLMSKGLTEYGSYMNSKLSNQYVDEYSSCDDHLEAALKSLNESDINGIEADIVRVTKKISVWCEQLKVKSDKVQYNLPAVLHFDEVQEHWVSKPIPKAQRENEKMDSTQILDVGFTCFTDAINSLVDNSEICFALTGTAMGLSEVIRVSSALKPYKVELACPELSLFLRTETNLNDDQIEQCKVLEGNPRGFHYFIQAASQNSDVQTCLASAYKTWSADVGALYKYYLRCERIFDEIMLAMTFFDSFDGKIEKNIHQQIVYKFPIASLPQHWLEHANAGVLRLDLTAEHFFLYQPHNFLQKKMKEQLKILEFTDVMDLQSAVNDAATFGPDKRKGLTFQLACALELCWLGSELWEHILDSINKNRPAERKVAPIIENSCPQKIKYVESDDDVKGKDGMIYMARDVAGKTKTGDIQIPNSFQTKNKTTVKIFIECKNSTSFNYLCRTAEEGFFEKCASREIDEKTEEIYILLSYEKIQQKHNTNQWFKKLVSHCGTCNNNKQFNMLFDIQNAKSTIGIRQLSEPQKISLCGFLEEFPNLKEISRGAEEELKKLRKALGGEKGMSKEEIEKQNRIEENKQLIQCWGNDMVKKWMENTKNQQQKSVFRDEVRNEFANQEVEGEYLLALGLNEKYESELGGKYHMNGNDIFKFKNQFKKLLEIPNLKELSNSWSS